jgi:hypothetical protein
MCRFPPTLIRMFVLALAFCSLCGVALAAEPDGNPAQGDGQAETSFLENNVPLVIGGAITVFVLAVGLVVLSAKQSEPAGNFDGSAAGDPLRPGVVGAANPERYLVMPTMVMGLLAAGLSLGYSIWKTMPDTETLMNPSMIQQQSRDIPGLNTPPPIDSADLNTTPLRVNPAIHNQRRGFGDPQLSRRGPERKRL